MKRIRIIDELRGLAIILVVLIHMGQFPGFPAISKYASGVDIFLLVSGFVLSYYLAGATWREFLSRRLARILPSYWIALTLFLVIGAKVSGASTVLHYLLLHGFGPERYFVEINPVFWFISAEVVLGYLFFLAIRKRLSNIPFVLHAGCVVILTLGLFYTFMGNYHALGIISHFPSFLLGLIFGSLIQGRAILESTEASRRLLITSGALLITSAVIAPGLDFLYVLGGVLEIAAFMAIRLLLVRTRFGIRILSVLAYIGTISYEIYLFHYLVYGYNMYVLASWFHVLPIGDSSGVTALQVWLEFIPAMAVVTAISIYVGRFTNWTRGSIIRIEN